MIYGLLSTIFFIGCFILFSSIFSIKYQTNKLTLRLNRIKNLGKANLSYIKNGFAIFEPFRMLLGNFFDLQYLLSNINKKLKIIGLNKHLNALDLILLKGISILTTITVFTLYIKQQLRIKSIDELLADNFILLLLFVIILIFVISFDNLAFYLIKRHRNSEISKRMVFFINLFKSNIAAGDNLYQALYNCSVEIPGLLGNAIGKACRSFSTVGKQRALTELAGSFEMEEFRDFINLLLIGEESKSQDFVQFLNENEVKLQDIKKSRTLLKQSTKPVQAIFANLFGLIAIILLMITALVMALQKYINIL